MAFTYTPVEHGATTKLSDVTEIAPGLFQANGTWTATAVTEGEIVSGFDHLLFGFYIADNGTVREQAWNTNSNGTAEAGTMGLILCTSGASGQYFYIGYNDPAAFV